MSKDEFSGQGGSYVIDKDGKRMRVETPTQDHPEGNRPRDAEGKPLDFAAAAGAPPIPAAPAPEAAPRRARISPAAASGD